jgi:ribosome maturation protein SDO1
MTQTTARINKAGKHFEIVVDLDEALKIKKDEGGSITRALEGDTIYSDSKKGEKSSESDLNEAFKTTNLYEVAEKIIKEGEVLLTQEFRDEAREQKIKQVVDFLTKNAIDPQTNNPITEDRIKSGLEQARVNIQDKPIDSQIPSIMDGLSKVMPIKIQTKKIKIVIPAQYTGQIYGGINQYKEKEEWKDNGDLQVVVNVPSGMIMNFYDKLNSVTHGAATSEEIAEAENEGEKNE